MVNSPTQLRHCSNYFMESFAEWKEKECTKRWRRRACEWTLNAHTQKSKRTYNVGCWSIFSVYALASSMKYVRVWHAIRANGATSVSPMLWVGWRGKSGIKQNRKPQLYVFVPFYWMVEVSRIRLIERIFFVMFAFMNAECRYYSDLNAWMLECDVAHGSGFGPRISAIALVSAFIFYVTPLAYTHAHKHALVMTALLVTNSAGHVSAVCVCARSCGRQESMCEWIGARPV